MSATASVSTSPAKKKHKNKDYSNTIRVFDPQDGYRLRADSICFKDETKNEVLMISSRNEASWSIPGGGLEPNEEPGKTAVREAFEEAGVRAEVMEFIGTFDDDERKNRTHVYTLVVREEIQSWKEKNEFDRARQWFKCEEAVQFMMAKKPLKGEYLRKACESVPPQRQTNGSDQAVQQQQSTHSQVPCIGNGTVISPS